MSQITANTPTVTTRDKHGVVTDYMEGLHREESGTQTDSGIATSSGGTAISESHQASSSQSRKIGPESTSSISVPVAAPSQSGEVLQHHDGGRLAVASQEEVPPQYDEQWRDD